MWKNHGTVSVWDDDTMHFDMGLCTDRYAVQKSETALNMGDSTPDLKLEMIKIYIYFNI